jgi:hypothetical protein
VPSLAFLLGSMGGSYMSVSVAVGDSEAAREGRNSFMVCCGSRRLDHEFDKLTKLYFYLAR